MHKSVAIVLPIWLTPAMMPWRHPQRRRRSQRTGRRTAPA